MKIVENMCLKCMFGKMELSCGYQSITHEYAGEGVSRKKNSIQCPKSGSATSLCYTDFIIVQTNTD